jgi:coenzyme F420-reducing hydrogenase alpha subunit
MSDPAGKLQIRIGPTGTTIGSSRPVRAASVFVGREPGETARLLPALFSICATAQSVACAGALDQAQGLEPAPSVLAQRRRLVEAETLREHLWRILLDWPRLLDLEPDVQAMARAMDGYARLRVALARGKDQLEQGGGSEKPVSDAAREAMGVLADLVAERVLGTAPGNWLDSLQGLDALAAWSMGTSTGAARLVTRVLDDDHADLGRSEIETLPESDAVRISAELGPRLGSGAADEFVARPTWDGEPRETSPLTRGLDAPLVRDLVARFGNGILTRLAAQLLEVARIASGAEPAGEIPAAGPRTPGADDRMPLSLAPGVGLAQVPAARGLLIHRVEVRDGRVADYRILAPTEWNFHPQGVVTAGLDAIAARVRGPELGPLAELFVAAVDPCVDFDLVER